METQQASSVSTQTKNKIQLKAQHSLLAVSQLMFRSLLVLTFLTTSPLASTFSTQDLNELIQDMKKGKIESALRRIDKIPEAKINHPFSRGGGTLLHALIQRSYHNNPEHFGTILEKLAARGLDVNRRDDARKTALFYLTQNSKKTEDPLLLLVRHGANINLKDFYGRTALHIYAERGNAGLVKALLNLGAKLNLADQYGVTPLMLAASKGHLNAVTFFVKKEANIAAKDNLGNGILHFAAKSHNLEVIDYLLDKNTPINYRNNKNETPISILASRGKWSLVRLLLDYGADINVPFGRNGSLGLHLLLNPNLGFSANFLAKTGIDVNAHGLFGEPPILHAIGNADLDTLERLISLGVDVNYTGKSNLPAIPLVANRDPQRHKNIVNVLKLLLDNGAKINATNRTGQTGLYIAVNNDHPDMVKLLVNRGAHFAGKPKKLSSIILKTNGYEIALALLNSKLNIPIDLENSFLWDRLTLLAKKVEEEEAQGKIGIATTLFKKIFKNKTVVNLKAGQGINSRLIQEARDKLYNSSSKTVLNSLVKVSFVNEPQTKRLSLPTIIKIPKRKYSEIAKLHIIGIYQAFKENRTPWWPKCSGDPPIEAPECHRRYASKHEEGVIQVSVAAKKNPVILALMAYEPTHWVIKKTTGVKIEGIILSGYHNQRISGVNSETPLDVFTYDPSDCNNCQVGDGYFYAYERNSAKMTEVNRRLMDLTGRSATSFQGKYSGKNFVILDY